MSPKMLLVAACLAMPAVASADKLNVKPGLWEITSTSQISGLPPIPKDVLDKMTPEKRAQMEASFRAEAAKGPQVETDRECITKEELERPFESADAKQCTQTIVTTTRTSQEVRLTCSGEHKGSGLLRVSTPTPETMTGTMDLKLGEGKDAMTINAKLKGHWLGPQCGDEGQDEDANADEDDEAAADTEEEEEE